MRRALILLSFAIILLVAAAHVYRDPRVQDLFRSVPKAGSAKKQIVRPATRAPLEQPTGAESSAAPVAVVKNQAPPQEHDIASARPDQTPNDTVSRVLLQILAAKGLARGIALEVSDESIRIFGEVDSDDKRQKIIGLIEKGRESRRLDTTRLTIQR